MFWFNRIYIQRNVWFRRGYGPVLAADIAPDADGSKIWAKVRMSLGGLAITGFWIIGTGIIGTGIIGLGWLRGEALEAMPMTIAWGILTVLLAMGVIFGRTEREGLMTFLEAVAEAKHVGRNAHG